MSVNTNENLPATPSFPRRPQTTVMGAMGLALLAVMSWAFIHELPSRGAPGPHYARHTAVVHARG